jgi:hypothetical protein
MDMESKVVRSLQLTVPEKTLKAKLWIGQTQCYILDVEYLPRAHVLKAGSPAYDATGKWWIL